MHAEAKLDYALREVKPDTMIYEIRHALTDGVCRDMIDRFESNPEQQYPGRIGQDETQESSIKRSTDLRISGRKDWQHVDRGLFLSLSTALRELSTLHPFFANSAFQDLGYNMQRTLPDEYYHWHVDSGPGPFSHRQLVAIWYLNDVDGGSGGETEFHFQDAVIRPQAGKLLLFPPFWMHVHRGVTLRRGVKYIATTWVCFAHDSAG